MLLFQIVLFLFMISHCFIFNSDPFTNAAQLLLFKTLVTHSSSGELLKNFITHIIRLTNGQPGKESQNEWLHRYKYWDRTHAKKKETHNMTCSVYLV